MSKTARLYATTIAITSLFACLPASAQGELGGLKGIGGLGGGCKGTGAAPVRRWGSSPGAMVVSLSCGPMIHAGS